MPVCTSEMIVQSLMVFFTIDSELFIFYLETLNEKEVCRGGDVSGETIKMGRCNC